MINWTLYKQELKHSLKLLLILGAVITLYVSVIIRMYDPQLAHLLDSYVELLPGLMSSVGMTTGAANLLEFMSSYLYGFILLILPMLFCMLRGNGLISKYVERGSLVYLVFASTKRRTIALTQAAVLLSGLFILLLYSTLLELVCAAHFFPGELDIPTFLTLNAGLACLHFFIAGICFLASCIFSETKFSAGFGAGIPLFMYVLQMLANVGETAKPAKYFTFFTLFHPDGLIGGDTAAFAGILILLFGGVLLFGSAITVFHQKDLHI